MRNTPNMKAESARIMRRGMFASVPEDGNNGAFVFKHRGVELCVLSGHGDGWEHVSVSTASRCPTWDEMCHIKDIFWNDEEIVYQIHPAKSAYVNYHPYTLHLWRPIGQEFPLPPAIMVGPSHAGEVPMDGIERLVRSVDTILVGGENAR